MTAEVWAPLPGFAGRYEVSNLGRIRSLWCRQGRRLCPMLLKPYRTQDGALTINLVGPDGEKCLRRVRRLVATVFGDDA